MVFTNVACMPEADTAVGLWDRTLVLSEWSQCTIAGALMCAKQLGPSHGLGLASK